MKIIIDAMGGDNAPVETVKGAFDAAEKYDTDIILIGDSVKITQVCRDNNLDLFANKRITVVDTPVAITMEDEALSVVRAKKDSSMGIGLEMLKKGEADAMVSAGNTGALHAGSSLIVRRIKGVARSAIATVLPFEKPTLLIDSGANTELNAEQMLQLGIMGSIYMEKVLGVEHPKVGLLNNGTEPTKGTKVLVEAYQLMRESTEMDFYGNIEGKTIANGDVDVIVTDGFTGNVLLKSIEGLSSFFMKKLKGMYMANPVTKLSALPMKKPMKEFKHSFSVSDYGGAPLLGLSKPVIKAHGSSDALAISNAVRQAKAFIEQDVIVEIVKRLCNDSEKKDRDEEAEKAEK